MDRVNPVYVPRNQLVEDALAAAVGGDLAPYERLVEAVTQPFEGRPGSSRTRSRHRPPRRRTGRSAAPEPPGRTSRDGTCSARRGLRAIPCRSGPAGARIDRRDRGERS